jgi:alkylhydroperoxidase family enzyme
MSDEGSERAEVGRPESGSGAPRAWIDVIPEDQAEGLLAELYEQERVPQTGAVDNIMMVHSLHAETLRDHAVLYKTLMFGTGGLSRPEREMIGVVVSAANRCHY